LIFGWAKKLINIPIKMLQKNGHIINPELPIQEGYREVDLKMVRSDFDF